MSAYVPVWVKSNFSFLEGASHPHELVEQAHLYGLPAVALTDRDGVYGVVQAHMKAKELGIELLLGSEVTVGSSDDSTQRAVLLAQSRTGYGDLCRLISKGRLRSEKGKCMVRVDELCDTADHLLALIPDAELLPPIADAFGDRLYALIARHLHDDEEPREDRLRTAAKHLGIPTVAAVEVLYHTPNRQPLQDVLTCIRYGTTLSAAGTLLKPNAEYCIKTELAMRRLFADDAASLAASLEIAERCNFSLDQLRYRYPGERIPDGLTEESWLRQLTLKGAQRRYPSGIPAAVLTQLEAELTLIQELEYGGYFLTMYEIVDFCRRKKILCQGRGSAANSVVCYCLGVTAVDPIKLDLLFERFLSRERAEPPDIDLDIEHERREEVIQWVYERYGRKHAAMVANVIRYRTRSAIREVGKALGLPETALDRLSKLLGSRFSELHHDALTQSGLDHAAQLHEHLLTLVDEIREFPRHLSIHPGGFLLGSEPIETIVPLENAAMENRTVIQWDKYSVEDLNLFKVDLLGLGALTQSRKFFELLEKHRGIKMGLADIPHDDPDTYELISRGDTVGVFQIESRAQMSMLPRLKPRKYYDLVIEVAIVRPGPIQGDMVHPYLRRRNHEEAEDYPHPALKKALGKTLGVPIFQEQVMRVAMLVGGYSGGEANQLRKDMAAWKSSGRIDRHHQKLTRRMVKNGISPEYAERIFNQIRGFGEYGFPESHAASFALIAYATSWMRCHHPAFFSCSLLNALPMGFYSAATLVEDAKRKGVEVRPVDVNRSEWGCTIESSGSDFAIRMGLRHVKGLGAREQEAFGRAKGPYADLESFVRRTRLSTRAFTQIAEAGALESFGVHRRNAVWEVKKLSAKLHDSMPLPERVKGQQPLFQSLSAPEQVFWDYRTAEHSARGHPLQAIRSELQLRGIPNAQTLNAMRDGAKTKYVGMTVCRQQPGTATGVTFYTLEDETGFVNVVVWQPVFQKHSVLARTALLMGVTGKVQSESGVVHLIANKLWDPELSFHPKGTTTRSFH